MTDGETTGAIIAAISAATGVLGTTLRWAVNRVTKSNDDSTAAIIANTASNATLSAKLDELSRRIERLDDFVKDEISGVHDGPPQPTTKKARTPPKGVGLYGIRKDED